MSELLFHYKPVYPTTWVYLSSLLLIGLFFKFNRFWSVRNLDLVLLILLAPGLLLVHSGERSMTGTEDAASLPPVPPATAGPSVAVPPAQFHLARFK